MGEANLTSKKINSQSKPKTIGKTSQFGLCQAISMQNIVDSPYQVRVDYGDIKGLAQDIREKGLLQPILVRPKNGKFEIVHGHRRHKAVELLGWTHIDGFSKELSDSEAITIQGSENIWRKDYTSIEEAKLYYNYRRFLEKERGQKILIMEVANAFKVSEDTVIAKIDLLELPLEIQAKLQRGELPFSKVRALSILVREKVAHADRRVHGVEGSEAAPRTDRFYSQIRKLSEEIEKGALGGLRTEKGVSSAATAIRDGGDYDVAVKKAKIDEAIEIAQKDLRRGKSPEEVLKSIVEHQSDPSEVLEATIEANIGLLKKMLTQKLILCPYCRKPDLMWSCKHELLVSKDEGETN